MTIYSIIVIAAWTVFIVVWFTSAWSAKRNVGFAWRGITIRIIAIGVVAWIVSEVHPGAPGIWLLRAAPYPGLAGLGAALAVIGVAFAVWARYHLGRNWGMPQSVKENPELVTDGPYAYARHPIYTGVLLAILGSTLTVGLWWLVVFVVGAAYFIYSAMQEEKLMAKTFPSTYPAYKARTKFLIPFII